jgi:hypothetical protein
MRIRLKKWGMINIIPSFNIIHVVEDDPPYAFDHSLVEIIVLGYILNIDVSLKLPPCGTGSYGPHWSRKKKHWKFL